MSLFVMCSTKLDATVAAFWTLGGLGRAPFFSLWGTDKTNNEHTSALTGIKIKNKQHLA